MAEYPKKTYTLTGTLKRMAEYIPFEIQEEIIKRLPVKSLIRLSSVSKQWKSFIYSSNFIAHYHTDQQHLLVRYVDSEVNYVSIVDDNTFPQNKFSLVVPTSLQQFNLNLIVPHNNRFPTQYNQSTIFGISQGLFCLYNFFGSPVDSGTNMAAIWNPAIGKSVAFNVPNVFRFPFETILGIGVCPNTSDVKLVKITYFAYGEWDGVTSIPNQVEVLTLSSGSWRSPSCNNLPRKSITIVTDDQVDIDGFIYWLAVDYEPMDAQSLYDDLILSFDITSEEFTQVYLPASLATDITDISLSIFKLRESLAVLEYNFKAETRVYGVWMMVHGVPNSFKKLFAINTPDASIEMVCGFRKNGEVIIEIEHSKEQDKLFVLDPSSQRINSIGITGKRSSCFARFYVDSLLLLDR